MLANEPREVVEERIKSTVIRRRTVRTLIEIPVEEAPETEVTEKTEDHPEKDWLASSRKNLQHSCRQR
ncbi:MAG: hypothetical protein M0C28_26135 [Candidatus Moduliflexus flocculans]|nr:hypothetical protein [Candidatus Moduliflexus flocculans]